MNKILKILLMTMGSIIVIFILIFIFLILTNRTIDSYNGDISITKHTYISSEKCGLDGGRILNTLSNNNCFENETDIGEIKGLKCPCICCIPLK